MRLLVLGVVRRHGQAHGYAVQRELVSWRIETWTRVRPGSIYHALKQLAGEDKLRVVGDEAPPGAGRTVYAITDAGTAEFLTLLESALVSVDPEQVGAGVALMDALPPERTLELLKVQRARADENRRHLESLILIAPDGDDPPHRADLLALWNGLLGATVDWTDALIRRLDAEANAPAGPGGGSEATSGEGRKDHQHRPWSVALSGPKAAKRPDSPT